MQRWIVPVIGVLLATPFASGQATYPVEAVITSPEVEVRSFPSAKDYATSKLRMGDRVRILKEESKESPGWLEIAPPAGSFSWINEKSVTRLDAYRAIVKEGGAGVRPGSSLTKEPPKVEKVKLSAGTQVVVLGPPEKDQSESFLPIRPHVTEVRYIPAAAVKPQNVAQQQITAPSGAASTFYAPGNPLLEQAEAAYRVGDHKRAELIFRQVYDDKASHPNHKIYAGNRLSTLSGPGKSPWQPGPGNVPAQTMSTTRPPSTSQYSTANPSTSGPQWSRYGRLRPTAIKKDGQPLYVLEDERFNALMYVMPAPGLSLKDFVGCYVAFFGPITYYSDNYIRTHYMTATDVAIPRHDAARK